jgi:hypothetical protein
MIILDEKKVLTCGFHEHWHRIDTDNTAYLLSALNFHNYDFVTLMDGYDQSTKFQKEAEKYTKKIKLHPGKEYGCPWGHIVAIGFKNNCVEDDIYHELTLITEIDKVFERLRESYELVILAHPDYEITWRELFLTGEIDKLIDDEIIDAVNLINSSGFSQPRHRLLIDWYEKREKTGRQTPIVGGWDAHLMINRINDPEILYTDRHPPKGHIDTAGSNRSVLIDCENNLPSIIKAVKECRVVIEDIESGEFVGPKGWIDFLHDNEYHEKTASLAAQRSAISVEKQRKWLLNEPVEITFNKNGTLLHPSRENIIEKTTIIADEPAKLANISLGLTRDELGIPVAFTSDDGVEAIYTVRASHPIRLDVQSKYENGKCYLEINVLIPLDGEIIINTRLFKSPLRKKVSKNQSKLLIEVSPKDTYPVAYAIEATNSNGLIREIEGTVTFYPVKQFRNAWHDIPVIKIDRNQFAPEELGYGNTEAWIGPKLFSGAIQIAWTPKALHFRIDVTDPIHDQPLEGHFTYDADCVQIAIDPLNLRREYRGHFYNYNLALTKNGPELFQMFTPNLDENDNPISIPEDRSLGNKHLTIKKRENGLIYDLALPWELLGLSKPSAGDRMGIHIILLNSNGNGVINNLRWPVVIPGLWMIPNKWGTISIA